MLDTFTDVQWARLHHRTPADPPAGDRLGWQLWPRRMFFPHEEMRTGFRYLITEDDGLHRATQTLGTVTSFLNFTAITSLTDAYYLARPHFSLGMSLTEWLLHPYNADRAHQRLFCMWSLHAQPIDPIVLQGPFNRTGWMRLADGGE